MVLHALDAAHCGGATQRRAHLIRDVTPDDLEWVFALAKASYRPFNEDAIRAYLGRITQVPRDFLFIRAETGFLLADLVRPQAWPHEKEVHMVALAVESGPGIAGYRLLKAMVAWGDEVGADRTYFSASTGVDFGPFAKRLGAVPDDPHFIIRR